MRNTLLLTALLLSSVASAQITIGEDDMPSSGDTIRLRTGDGSGIAFDQTGPDHVWDFGDMLPQAEVADTAVTVGSTPFLYQFFFNNGILYPAYVADYAVKGINIGFQQVSLSDVYDYFRADADGFRNVGFGANVNGLPTSVRRQPVDVIHQFPMNYGDEDSSASAFNVSIPTLAYFGQDQMRHNYVDGWGTLYLPADTFEVLRVRSVLARTDTIFVEQFGIGFRLPEPETVEYKWIAQGMDLPVLQVTTVGGVVTTTRFHYSLEDITTGVGVESVIETPEVFPNPAYDHTMVRLPQNVGGAIHVLDASGREVLHVPGIGRGAVQRLDLTGMAAGTYTVRMVGLPEWSTKLVVTE
ncbi:MAG: T9SS type A sorting domain-containing protein [Flavobacteriales bacterium]|nr:T9SS type A sorting domain-containing protein [Flavobacteriales bacterium]HQV73906.1 hypothetical protein [Flavobacteriales bacterium]